MDHFLLLISLGLTRCQRAQAYTLLSGWKRGSDIMTTSYKPLCDKVEPHTDGIHVHTHTHKHSVNEWPCVFQDGSFSVLQTDGAAGWCVSPLTGEMIQAATPSLRGHLTCIHPVSLSLDSLTFLSHLPHLSPPPPSLLSLSLFSLTCLSLSVSSHSHLLSL